MHLLIFTTVLPLTVPALGYPELKWYASRSAVVCTEVPEQGVRLRVRDASGRVAFEGDVDGPRAVIPVGRDGGSLPNGLYCAELVHDKDVVCSHDFVHTNYPWFNSSVGKANPVVQADPDVVVSTYRRGDRLLLVIGSFAKTAVELPLRLRKGRIVRAVDLETDKPLACDRGAASLRLKSHDFALVLVVGETLTGSPLARR